MEIEKIEHSPTFKTMDGEEHETKEAAIAHLRRQAIEDMFTRLLSTSAPAHANQSCVTIANSLNEKFDKFCQEMDVLMDSYREIPVFDSGQSEVGPSIPAPALDCTEAELMWWAGQLCEENPEELHAGDIAAAADSFGWTMEFTEEATVVSGARALLEMVHKNRADVASE